MLSTAARFAALLMLLSLAAPAIVRADSAAPDAKADSSTTTPELFDTDRPDVTDGSSRLDPGDIQLETGWSRTSQEGLKFDSFGDGLVRIGVSRAFELRVFTPGRERFSHGEVSDGEWGEAGFGFKLGRTSSDGNRGIALVASIATPVESHGTRVTDTEAVLAGDWPLGDGGASFNLGIHHLSGNGTSTDDVLASCSIDHEITQRVGMFVELAAESSQEHSAMLVDTGVSWAVAQHLQLDASVGRDTESGGPWTLGAGLSKRW